MNNFSKVFVTNLGAYRFNFSKVEMSTSKKYFVSVEDGTLRITTFDIKQDKNGQWKVVEPAPPYIVQEEARLAATIEENNSRNLVNRYY